jgi:hypothetical protein
LAIFSFETRDQWIGDDARLISTLLADEPGSVPVMLIVDALDNVINIGEAALAGTEDLSNRFRCLHVVSG